MSKKATFILFLFILLKTAAGQQSEQYSQYLFNAFAVNPALAGSSNCIDVKGGTRLQWIGFEGAPWTSFLTIHKAVGKKDFKKSWHGIGGYIVDDRSTMPREGSYAFSGVFPAYAYHLQVHRATILSVGIYAGIRQYSFQGLNNNDPALGSSSTFILPDITPGIWLNSKKTFAGLSVKQTYKNKMSGFGGSIGTPNKLNRHFYLMLGKRIQSKQYYYTFIPSMQVKYTPLYPPAVDLNLMMFIKSTMGYGVGIRNTDGIVAMVRLKILDDITMGYSYDFVTSKVRTWVNTHELMISFSPCGADDGEEKKHCPAY